MTLYKLVQSYNIRTREFCVLVFKENVFIDRVENISLHGNEEYLKKGSIQIYHDKLERLKSLILRKIDNYGN